MKIGNDAEGIGQIKQLGRWENCCGLLLLLLIKLKIMFHHLLEFCNSFFINKLLEYVNSQL